MQQHLENQQREVKWQLKGGRIHERSEKGSGNEEQEKQGTEKSSEELQ